MKHYPRLDGNHKQIVQELRQFPGVSVHSTAQLGGGFGDIVVGYKKTNYLFEIKDPTKPPSSRVLTPDEQKFHSNWSGQIDTVMSTEDVLKRIGYPIAGAS